MSAIRRSPKIPLSPSSPPETGLKRRRESDGDTKRLPSPGYMSIATKSYVSNYPSQNMHETASRSSPRSPASSASYNNNSTQRASQPYSTPTSSTSGIPGLSMTEDPDQHRDKRQRMEPREAGNADAMDMDSSVLPTNHDRSAEEKKEEGATPNVLKEELGENEIGDSLDQLQKDMGDPFLLCSSKVQPSRPDPSQHLLGIYGLVPLLKDVIRADPVTGDKANRLRKSYEGQIKKFGLAGRNSSVTCERVKHPADQAEPGPLRKAIGSEWRGLQSDDDWKKNHPTPEIKIDEALRLKLRKALQIQPGTIRNPEVWDEYLGHDRARQNVAPPPVTAPQQRLTNGAMPPRPREVGEVKRATRGKKRSYDDDSFVGYGDGYSDIEDAGARDDEDDGGSRRKRRKESTTGPFSYAQR